MWLTACARFGPAAAIHFAATVVDLSADVYSVFPCHWCWQVDRRPFAPEVHGAEGNPNGGGRHEDSRCRLRCPAVERSMAGWRTANGVVDVELRGRSRRRVVRHLDRGPVTGREHPG